MSFDDLKQWLTEQKPQPKADRAKANRDVHAKLDREEPLDETLQRMLEELEWQDQELVCLRVTQECKCGSVETYTAGTFVKRIHPRKHGHRLVPIKFFPSQELPKVHEESLIHLDLCKSCFVEEHDATLVDELLARFEGRTTQPLVQLSLFNELPLQRSH